MEHHLEFRSGWHKSPHTGSAAGPVINALLAREKMSPNKNHAITLLDLLVTATLRNIREATLQGEYSYTYSGMLPLPPDVMELRTSLNYDRKRCWTVVS